jgi:hypothetical protein
MGVGVVAGGVETGFGMGVDTGTGRRTSTCSRLERKDRRICRCLLFFLRLLLAMAALEPAESDPVSAKVEAGLIEPGPELM